MTERFTPSELLPMLPSQDDVCEICFQWSDGFPVCHACREIRATLRRSDIDVAAINLLPISLASQWDALAKALWGYKNNDDAAVRAGYAPKIENLLHDFVAEHGKCLGAASGGRTFDAITWVPSAQGDRVGRPHPLAQMVHRAPWNHQRTSELLRRTEAIVNNHKIHPRRFETVASVSGKSVLVVDDTWTTGANAMSAAWTLRNAGATVVSIVVIGRWNDPQYREYGIYRRHANDVGFDMNCCVYCDPRPGLVIDRTPRRSPPAEVDLWAPGPDNAPPF